MTRKTTSYFSKSRYTSYCSGGNDCLEKHLPLITLKFFYEISQLDVLAVMKFSFKFCNLLGTVYRKGNLVYSPDGNSVYSPVGNRITFYDLKNNKSQTLAIENRFNYECLDISPNGLLLAAVNEQGEIHLISLMSKTILHKYRINRSVSCLKFSPDGKYLSVLKENNAFIFKCPGSHDRNFNTFEMVKVYHGAHDYTVCIDWSSDSKVLAIGSKDMIVRVHSLEKISSFRTHCLGSHREPIVACFFEDNSLDISTISRDGQLCFWECSIGLEDLDSLSFSAKKRKKFKDDGNDSDSEDDVDERRCEKNITELENTFSQSTDVENKSDKEENENGEYKMYYKRTSRLNLCTQLKKDDPHVALTCAAYHKTIHILVSGFSNGSFLLHELPSVTLIHSLSICQHEISTVSLNSTGDWIALASSTLGQLLVWEWQSETYVMKQQGHINNMTCLSYSPDGMYIATGGYDGKVKLWNTSSGFCFVTFTEHSSSVTDIQFSQNRKFVVSASLDGTVRAFDMVRYRNFKTFTSPTPAQFACLSIDTNGEFIAAGGQDTFEIYIWSLKIGRLCEILVGHEGPIAGVAFRPTLGSTTLASVSWDRTLRLWDAVDSSHENEVFLLGGDGLAVTFRPDGEEVAVATLDGQICFFDVKNRLQSSYLEGRNDLGSGLSETDLVSAKKNSSAKAFTTLCYTADGSCIIAGGHSKNVCIYNIKESMLLKKFEITQNRSLDNVDDFIYRRKMTEFGNVDLMEEREDGNVKIRLPGVRQGDLTSRSTKPEVRVFCLEFSPTGQAWAAATTEGILIYSLDLSLVFDPLELSEGITSEALRDTVKQENHAKALMMAIKLGEKHLVQEVMENVPYSNIEFCVASIAHSYIVRCLKFIICLLENTKHLEFYLTWVRHILTIHGSHVKFYSDFLPVLLALGKNLTKYREQLGKICEYNKYTIEFYLKIGKLRKDCKMMIECIEENVRDEELMADEFELVKVDSLHQASI